jgi:hypothetical protein
VLEPVFSAAKAAAVAGPTQARGETAATADSLAGAGAVVVRPSRVPREALAELAAQDK